MYIIGVTGGIGTGKSTATEYLRSKGFGYIDADQIGRNLTADGQPLLEIISDEFGCVEKKSDIGNGLVLNRRALASLVFNDENAKAKFDSIIHSRIISVIDASIKEFEEKEGQGVFAGNVILDAPLLFEAGINDKCDIVILIICDFDERIRRVCERDGMTYDEVKERIRNQMDDNSKMKMADYVVDNSGSEEELFKQLDDILDSL